MGNRASFTNHNRIILVSLDQKRIFYILTCSLSQHSPTDLTHTASPPQSLSVWKHSQSVRGSRVQWGSPWEPQLPLQFIQSGVMWCLVKKLSKISQFQEDIDLPLVGLMGNSNILPVSSCTLNVLCWLKPMSIVLFLQSSFSLIPWPM